MNWLYPIEDIVYFRYVAEFFPVINIERNWNFDLIIDLVRLE